ncbi:monooxygenase [Aeromicrobium sp. PE09-221]|nr:monooxygenase [Aeromicrobium sp. PE09-221]
MLGLDLPLAGFSRSPGVVAEVSSAGGLGVLAATPYGPDELDRHLTWIAERCGGAPFGVDLLVPPGPMTESARSPLPSSHIEFVRDLLAEHGIEAPGLGALGHGSTTTTSISSAGVEALLDVTFAHRPALVANALGPAPARLVERAHAEDVLVAALIGSSAHARRQLDLGVDLLVAQGTEAGGHTGSIATMVLTPEIVDLAGDVPVLAAGGIADGRQLAASLALGAAGAWCGSVWLASEEDVTPMTVKRRLLRAGSGDTVRSAARTGKPARQLRSAWHDAWERSDAPEILPMDQQLLLSKDAWALIEAAAEEGRDVGDLTSFFVGQVVGRMTELRPTRQIVDDMVAGCLAAIGELRGPH